MLGYYIFVCVLYVILIVLVYMGHCCFTVIDYNVVDYDIYHCLFNMLYVLWLAIFSNLWGGGGLCCNVSGADITVPDRGGRISLCGLVSAAVIVECDGSCK